MASRFQGRDYPTLRQEIIDFVKERAPKTWDSNNASDPMIRFIETVALLGDHLNYYIDAMRRESDMATASLASSVYSYALREGYDVLLPSSTHFRINLYYDGDGDFTTVSFNKFDPFIQQNQKGDYFVLTPLATTDIYSLYPQTVTDADGNTVTIQSPEIEIVAGTMNEVNFNFSDIDYYSRIELPEARIDPDMCQLIAINGQKQIELLRVKDVVSDLEQVNVYSLTPSFVGGVERLYIEFPYNYRNLFPSNTSFLFRYLTIKEESKPVDLFESVEHEGVLGSNRWFGGYRLYENAEHVKMNYKNFVRDYSSLVTKSDYLGFVTWYLNARCEVFDKSDEYKGNFQNIPVRTIYIMSDLQYKGREELRDQILQRSSRSDNIFMIPYGRKLYRAFVIVEVNLMASSEESIKSSIESELSGFYNDISEVRTPIESIIYHKIHSCNESIVRAWVILISEYDSEVDSSTGITTHFTNFPTEDICSDPDALNNNLTNNGIFRFFYNLLPDDPDDPSTKDLSYLDRYSDLPLRKEEVIKQNLLLSNISSLAHFKGDATDSKSSYEYKYPDHLPYPDVNSELYLVDKNSDLYYDNPEIDTQSMDNPEYGITHFILPSLYDLIVWVYPT